jgi:hypothetical protein
METLPIKHETLNSNSSTAKKKKKREKEKREREKKNRRKILWTLKLISTLLLPS